MFYVNGSLIIVDIFPKMTLPSVITVWVLVVAEGRKRVIKREVKNGGCKLQMHIFSLILITWSFPMDNRQTKQMQQNEKRKKHLTITLIQLWWNNDSHTLNSTTNRVIKLHIYVCGKQVKTWALSISWSLSIRKMILFSRQTSNNFSIK